MRNNEPREMTSLPGETPTAEAMSTFTFREWVTLLQLRRRYRDGQDLWDARELEGLRFIRWLRNTGRMQS